jgi:hypothetical protein
MAKYGTRLLLFQIYPVLTIPWPDTSKHSLPSHYTLSWGIEVCAYGGMEMQCESFMGSVLFMS